MRAVRENEARVQDPPYNKLVVEASDTKVSPEHETRIIRSILKILVWFFIIFGFSTYLLFNYIYLETAAYTRGWLYDFKIFYSGSFDFFDGGSLYHCTATLPFDRIEDRNGNSPMGALVFIFLSFLSLDDAAKLWAAISLLLLLASLGLIWKVYQPTKSWAWPLLLLLGLCLTYPVAVSIQLGTWSIIIASLDFAAWYFGRKEAEGKAGMCLGLAVSFRWQPFCLFAYFLFKRRWRLIAYTLLTVMVGGITALMVFGFNNFAEFFYQAFCLTTAKRPTSPLDGSLKPFWGRILEGLFGSDADYDTLLTVVWSVSVVLLTGNALWCCRKLSYDYGFSLMLVLGLLLTPVTWVHYHLALLLPMVLLSKKLLWSTICIGVYWYFIDVAILLGFYESYPLIFGSLVTAYLLILYFYLCREPHEKYDLKR